MSTVNPWEVDSVQAFLCLKCPECTFDSKQKETFRDHALENHPLSFVLFGKACKEEDLNTSFLEDFLNNPGEISIKEEVPESNSTNSNVIPGRVHSRFQFQILH